MHRPASDLSGMPADAIGAVTHPDPYPFYAALRAKGPLLFDEGLQLWLATRADAVGAVLADPRCRVRPAAEPVPRGMAGQPAGEVFGQLVRMTDGPRQQAGKRALEQALRTVDATALQAQAQALAQRLAQHHRLDVPAQLGAWAFELPLHAVAQALGLAQGPGLITRVRDFVSGLAPSATAAQQQAAGGAATALRQQIHALLQQSHPPTPLLQSLRDAGWPDADMRAANLVGLLSQTYEATAGLLGNGIVALLRQPALRERLRDEPAFARAFVREVSRHDPSVQNTRRFVAEATTLCGAALKPGDTVLVLLASAARDPTLHDAPDEFRPGRAEAWQPGFGAGPHACPGQRLAHAIAAGALGALVRHAALAPTGGVSWRYRPSVNARIPEFHPA